MTDAACAEQFHIFVAHPAKQIGGSLKSTPEFRSRVEKAAGYPDGAVYVNQEIRIDQRDLIQPVPAHQTGHFRYHAGDVVGVETAIVEHHVGAVIARIRAPDAGGIGEFSPASGTLVIIEVDQ